MTSDSGTDRDRADRDQAAPGSDRDRADRERVAPGSDRNHADPGPDRDRVKPDRDRVEPDRQGLFVADFYPQLGGYLAGQHAAGYDAGPARARFQAWLGEHAETAGQDPVRDYLKQVSRVPGLTAAEEAELAKRIEAGRAAEARLAAGGDRLSAAERIDLEWMAEVGTRARNHLLEANLRLVVAVARRFTGRGLPFLDLVQEGNLGLIRAVEKFDYTKGYSFSTYATWWVRQAITRALAAAAKRPEDGQPPAEAEDPSAGAAGQPADPEG